MRLDRSSHADSTRLYQPCGEFNAGAWWKATCVAAALVVSAPLGLAQQFETAKLVASDFAFRDNFGSGTAIDGDTAMIGAYGDDFPGRNDAGSAYVFVRTGSTWAEQQKLLASDAAAGDRFGTDLAMDAGSAIIGAPGSDPGGVLGAGAAYVFVRTTTNWVEEQKLVANDPVADDLFGSAVALDGDTAIVGAERQDHPGGADAGAAYVFVRVGTSWALQQKLIASDAAANARFGAGVTIDGDTIVVGASTAKRPDGTNIGAAYVFVRSGNTWTEQQKLFVTEATNSSFGDAVSIKGDLVLVGAPNYTHAGSLGSAGSAYVFERTGTLWVQQQQLTASNIARLLSFGWSLALDGENAVIGSYSFFGAGYSAYHFRRTNGSWVEEQILAESDPVAVGFGWSVALKGTSVVVGALRANTGGLLEAGAAYVFEIAGVTPPENDECANATPVAIGDNGPFSSAGATPSAPAFSCAASAGSDVWYLWTAEGDGNAVIETCGSEFDTVLEVYSGTCGALSSIACNDDGCGSHSRVTFLAALGTTYLVRIGGAGAATGSHQVRVSLTGNLGSFQTVATGCDGLSLAASGAPTIGGLVSYDLSGVSGTPYLWFGAALPPMSVCPPSPCALGAEIVIVANAASAQLIVPLDVSLIGGMLACQGADYSLVAGSCPIGEPFQVRMSDTVITTIQ